MTYKLNVHEDILGSGTWYTRQESGYNANHHDYTTWGNNTKAPTYNYDPEYRATEPYYTGHPYDGSLNIYYAKNRFYDAETGSWLSPDPAKAGLNWYQYCGSNPVTYVDPLGLVSIRKDSFQDYTYFDQMLGSERSEQEREGLIVKANEEMLNQFLYGANLKMSDIEKVLEYLADYSGEKLTRYESKTYKDKVNYNQYDVMILGWVTYFNLKRDDSSKKYTISPEVIKAMMYRETRNGTYEKPDPSPNANTLIDVMQAIDPRNANIYEYVSIDHDGGNNILVINKEGKYVPLKSIDINYGCNSDSTKVYDEFEITEQLFKEQKNGDNVKYRYIYDVGTKSENTDGYLPQDVIRNISVAVGINKYATELDKVKGNEREAIKGYNSNPSIMEDYANEVLSIVNRGNQSKVNGGSGTILLE